MSLGYEAAETVTILVWCYDAREHLPRSRFRNLFQSLLKNQSEIKLEFPGYFERVFSLSPFRPIRDRIRPLRKLVGFKDFRLLGYSHDVGADHTAQVALQCWLEAKAFCYGDPPGFLYSRQEIERSAIAPQSVTRTLFSCGRNPDADLVWRYADHDCVALDLSGMAKSVSEREVLEIPRDFLQDTLRCLCAGLDPQCLEIQQDILRSNGSRPPSILLLSNFFESGIASRAGELRLYARLLQQHAPTGSLVLLKPHAGTTPSFIREIAASLSSHRVAPLPAEIAWMPVEMLQILVPSTRIISVSSASALLGLLYCNRNIAHGLSTELIEELFYPRWHEHFKKANDAILQRLRGLG